MIKLSVQEIRDKLKAADESEFAVLKRNLQGDDRKGVVAALKAAERRLEEQRSEALRIEGLYRFDAEALQQQGNGASVAVGLDEVGRGCLAGPVAVGAVVLSPDDPIARLNDSKQIKPEMREEIHDEIASRALACAVEYSSASDIDSLGIVEALKRAFMKAVRNIEGQGIRVDAILLDGNPLGLDEREISVVKGDARSACIAAASIFAKVERDRLMAELDLEYPGYEFAVNKGYGTQRHMELIRANGLSAIHRASFCGAFNQPALF